MHWSDILIAKEEGGSVLNCLSLSGLLLNRRKMHFALGLHIHTFKAVSGSDAQLPAMVGGV